MGNRSLKASIDIILSRDAGGSRKLLKIVASVDAIGVNIDEKLINDENYRWRNIYLLAYPSITESYQPPTINLSFRVLGFSGLAPSLIWNASVLVSLQLYEIKLSTRYLLRSRPGT